MTRSRKQPSRASRVAASGPRRRIDRVTRLHAYACAAIVLAGVAVYANALRGPFVWDDNAAIVTNQSIQRLSSSFIPPANTPVAGRPLVNVTFAINYAIGGLDVAGFHAGNLVFHLLAALALFGVVRRTLEHDWFAPDASSTATWAAAFAALWWVVHPLTSDVINYTAQRTEAVMGLCLFTTLYCAIRALDGPHRRRWALASIATCAAGMASKESMVIAPLIVILYDRVFAFPSWKETFRVRGRLHAGMAATWILLIALVWLQPRSNAGFQSDVDSWTYALNQFRMITHYLELAVFPRALVLDYGLPVPLTPGDVAWEAVVVLLLCIATVVCLVRWPGLGFLGAMFLCALAPTSSVIPIASEVGAERRMYVPLAAASVALFALGARSVQRQAALAQRLPAAAAVIAVAWVAALGIRTGLRNNDYRDPVALWQSSVDNWPNGRAQFSYALALAARRDYDAALEQFRLAVEDFPGARFSVAIELVRRGDVDGAIEQLQEFIRTAKTPDVAIEARALLGQLLAGQGKRVPAADQFRAVLDMVPGHPVANTSLGDLLMLERRYEEAIACYERVVALAPRNSALLVKLGLAQAAARRLLPAVESFRRAISIDPRSSLAHRSAARVLIDLGRLQEAEVHARAAVPLDAGSAEGHNLLGIALAAQGHVAEARPHFQKALSVDPDHLEARMNLTRIDRILGP